MAQLTPELKVSTERITSDVHDVQNSEQRIDNLQSFAGSICCKFNKLLSSFSGFLKNALRTNSNRSKNLVKINQNVQFLIESDRQCIRRYT